MKNYVPDELIKKDWEFKSRTRPDVTHLVTANPKSGELACDCEAFYYRKDCWHCRKARELEERAEYFPWRICPNNIREVTRRGNILYHPLIPLGRKDTGEILATIVYDLLRFGCSIGQVKKHFWIVPKEWGIVDVEQHIQKNGRYLQDENGVYHAVPLENEE